MQSSKNPQATPGSAKRRSGQLDFSNLGPLKAGGTVGFSAFRDQTTETSRRRKARKKSNGNIAEDSDDDDDDDDDSADNLNKMDDDDKDGEGKEASEDSKFGGELADGVNRIRVGVLRNALFFALYLKRCSLTERHSSSGRIRLIQTTTQLQRPLSEARPKTVQCLRYRRAFNHLVLSRVGAMYP